MFVRAAARFGATAYIPAIPAVSRTTITRQLGSLHTTHRCRVSTLSSITPRTTTNIVLQHVFVLPTSNNFRESKLYSTTGGNNGVGNGGDNGGNDGGDDSLDTLKLVGELIKNSDEIDAKKKQDMDDASSQQQQQQPQQTTPAEGKATPDQSTASGAETTEFTMLHKPEELVKADGDITKTNTVVPVRSAAGRGYLISQKTDNTWPKADRVIAVPLTFVAFPDTTVNLHVRNQKFVALFLNKSKAEGDGLPMHRIGTLSSTVIKDNMTASLMPTQRVIISEVLSKPRQGADPLFTVKIKPYEILAYDKNDLALKNLVDKVKSIMTSFETRYPDAIYTGDHAKYVKDHIIRIEDPLQFVHAVGNAFSSSFPLYWQAILESINVEDMLQQTVRLMEREQSLLDKQLDIHQRMESSTANKEQREFFLREQMRNLKRQAGLEIDRKDQLLEKYQDRIKSLKMPEHAMKVVNEEMNRLSILEHQSMEFSITSTYIDWLTSLPWGSYSEENFDLDVAQKVLDEDHFGLEDVKERIKEFIAVGKLNKSVQGKIICLVGPPGVGKTSIGKSIARALGRKFYRFSVGGMVDVAEIKGHRRTYIGAMPGKLVQCLKLVKAANPVILIDEIDKLGHGYSGDPASALLEVLDPAQNKAYLDHYLDVPFDLSQVLFVCTANLLDTIPKPLLDRMEVLKLSGYVASEQISIVKNFLFKHSREEAGLKPDQITITDGAIKELVKSYCREPGVRNLQKHMDKIMRKVAYKIVGGGKGPKVTSVIVTEKNLKDFVGKPVWSSDKHYETTPPGVVTGLAYTAAGGATLYIECVTDRAPVEGNASLRVTGQLGDVMKESTSIAYTYAKNHLETVAPGNKFFELNTLHLHVPEGATPKDGPSAGVTMVTALMSLALNKSVVQRLAMTGELTLTGKVLPIGGVKEKTIAAKRNDVKKLLLPIDNKKDFEELPDEIRQGIEVHYMEYYMDVFRHCFPSFRLPAGIVSPNQPVDETTQKTKKPSALVKRKRISSTKAKKEKGSTEEIEEAEAVEVETENNNSNESEQIENVEDSEKEKIDNVASDVSSESNVKTPTDEIK